MLGRFVGKAVLPVANASRSASKLKLDTKKEAGPFPALPFILPICIRLRSLKAISNPPFYLTQFQQTTAMDKIYYSPHGASVGVH